MYEFAYGSNLNRKQMLECCPDSKPDSIATLPNYKLVFVGWSRQWHGGVASIRHFGGEKVLGAIYEISDRDLRRLDKYKGYPDTYDRVKVTVYLDTGEPVEAITYIKLSQSEETKPSPEYLAAVKHGYRDWEII